MSREVGLILIWSGFRRQRTLNVDLSDRGSTGPLNLLVDSTGIKAEGEGEWNAHAVIPPRKNAKPSTAIPLLAVPSQKP